MLIHQLKMEKTDEQKAVEKAKKEAEKLKKAEEKKESEEKSVEKPEDVEIVKSLPQFKNNGNDVKIKLILDKQNDEENFKWITVKKGQIVTIPRNIALANKLVEVK